MAKIATIATGSKAKPIVCNWKLLVEEGVSELFLANLVLINPDDQGEWAWGQLCKYRPDEDTLLYIMIIDNTHIWEKKAASLLLDCYPNTKNARRVESLLSPKVLMATEDEENVSERISNPVTKARQILSMNLGNLFIIDKKKEKSFEADIMDFKRNSFERTQIWERRLRYMIDKKRYVDIARIDPEIGDEAWKSLTKPTRDVILAYAAYTRGEAQEIAWQELCGHNITTAELMEVMYFAPSYRKKAFEKLIPIATNDELEKLAEHFPTLSTPARTLIEMRKLTEQGY